MSGNTPQKYTNANIDIMDMRIPKSGHSVIASLSTVRLSTTHKAMFVTSRIENTKIAGEDSNAHFLITAFNSGPTVILLCWYSESLCA